MNPFFIPTRETIASAVFFGTTFEIWLAPSKKEDHRGQITIAGFVLTLDETQGEIPWR